MIQHLVNNYRQALICLILLLSMGMAETRGQTVTKGQSVKTMVRDSVRTMLEDSVVVVASDSIVAALDSMYNAMEKNDTLMKTVETGVDMQKANTFEEPRKDKAPRDWSKWRPNPNRALWMALVIPGGGQIYNRKFWKLPIFYGGFVGCIYAMSWNSMMYKDYQQAYRDIMDEDPNTASYNKFLHLGRQINDSNIERYKQIFKNRKDKYRRWRDMSFFVMVAIYAVSVIDAYVDAELSDFDISNDLSMKIRPAVIGSGLSRNPLYATSLGVNCSLSF